MGSESLLTPSLQYGFAGLAVLLIGVLVFLLKQQRDERQEIAAERKQSVEALANLLLENNRVIQANTAAFSEMSQQLHEQHRTWLDLRDRMLQRPCLLDGEKRQAGSLSHTGKS